jgi:hypothetical protein
MKRASAFVLSTILYAGLAAGTFAAPPPSSGVASTVSSAPGLEINWSVHVAPKLLLVTQMSETCFSKGEKTDGMNKTCFYSCPSGEAAITISATSLCPLSIKR